MTSEDFPLEAMKRTLGIAERMYLEGRICPHCLGSDICGVVVRGEYDGTLYWQCGSCQHAFQRWTEGRTHAKAQKFIDAINRKV